MNYLQLCQRLHQELGIGPGDPGDFPTAVASQTGQLKQIVTWINQAWTEIQFSQRAWLWMQGEAIGVETVNTGDKEVVLLGASADYDELLPYNSGWRPPYVTMGDSAFILMHMVSVGTQDNQEVYIVPWKEFNGYYDSDRWGNTQGRPRHCALSPDKKTLRIFPRVSEPYKLQYQYRKKVQTLTADADVPLLPTKYHMLIVYLAHVYYLRTNENNRLRNVFGNGLDDRSVPSSPMVKMYNDLCNEQLPTISGFGER